VADDEESDLGSDASPAVAAPTEADVTESDVTEVDVTEVEVIDVVIGDDGEAEIGVIEVELDSDAIAAEAAENAESIDGAGDVEPDVAEPVVEVVYPEDTVLLAAADQARAALLEITPAATIGEVVGSKAEGEHVLSLFFATKLPGYPGWHWTVTMSRIDEESAPSVLEIEMLPGEDALVAPDWLPWSERLAEYQLAQELAAALAAAEGDDHDDDDSDDGDDEHDDDDESDHDDELDDDDSDDDDSDDVDVDDDGLDLDDGIDIDDHVTDDDELEASAVHADGDDDDHADDEHDDDDADDFDGDDDDDDDPHAEGRLSER